MVYSQDSSRVLRGYPLNTTGALVKPLLSSNSRARMHAVQSWQRLCMSGWRELALEMTLEFLQHFEGTHREHIFLEMFKT